MSIQGLNYFRENWTLNNSLTINANVEVEKDLNTTGFIYNGGVPVNIQASNNVWTAANTFNTYLPTFLDPLTDLEMNTLNYTNTTATGVGNTLLPLNNVWTGANGMNEVPIITGAAVAANDLLNKTSADTIINSSTGALATNNVWTGTNTFNNVVDVPTPLVDGGFANKDYVDNALTAFNAGGGKIEYTELIASAPITCDPAIYSSMYIVMVAGGGFGNDGTGVGTAGTPFGGAGGMVAFKIPAFSPTYQLVMVDCVKGGVRASITLNDDSATPIASVTGGDDGNNDTSGVGGGSNIAPGLTGIQVVNGSTEPFQPTSATPAITRSYNIACLNGFGCGGSQIYLQPEVLPTGNYCLLVKFKN
jgi:hypothetical protein